MGFLRRAEGHLVSAPGTRLLIIQFSLVYPCVHDTTLSVISDSGQESTVASTNN